MTKKSIVRVNPKKADTGDKFSIPKPIINGTSIEQLISKALDSKTAVGVMERLLAMLVKEEARLAKKEYDSAMAAFQSSCPTIIKTKEVKINSGIVAYRYAPIEAIITQVKTVIEQNGFSYSFKQELKEAGVKVYCVVKHIAGHTEEYSMEVPLGTKTNIMSESQVVAAASTFAKRYAFVNAFGILTADEDNDGAKIAEPSKQVTATPPPAKPLPPGDGEDFMATKEFKLDVNTKVRELKLNIQQGMRMMNKAIGRPTAPDSDLDWYKLNTYVDMLAGDPEQLEALKRGE